VPVGLCEVITAVVNVAFNIVLVPVAGVEGVAIATLLAYFLRQALVIVAAGRVRELRRPPPTLILSCAAGMLVAVLCTRLPATGLFAYARVVATVLSLLVFGSMFEKLVAPGRDVWLLRAVSWANQLR
jgi:O-antigen/teichoic acid export membrane protein